jgi:hypothetical protein
MLINFKVNGYEKVHKKNESPAAAGLSELNQLNEKFIGITIHGYILFMN